MSLIPGDIITQLWDWIIILLVGILMKPWHFLRGAYRSKDSSRSKDGIEKEKKEKKGDRAGGPARLVVLPT